MFVRYCRFNSIAFNENKLIGAMRYYNGYSLRVVIGEDRVLNGGKYSYYFNMKYDNNIYIEVLKCCAMRREVIGFSFENDKYMIKIGYNTHIIYLANAGYSNYDTIIYKYDINAIHSRN